MQQNIYAEMEDNCVRTIKASSTQRGQVHWIRTIINHFLGAHDIRFIVETQGPAKTIDEQKIIEKIRKFDEKQNYKKTEFWEKRLNEAIKHNIEEKAKERISCDLHIPDYEKIKLSVNHFPIKKENIALFSKLSTEDYQYEVIKYLIQKGANIQELHKRYISENI